ncbi:MAG: four helix bundle protein [Myxococcales bacterium]|nr:four helix bundle protein [Myxococcales bacterium]
MTTPRHPLHALEVSHELVALLGPLLPRLASRDRALADQLRRAAMSVVLNLSEARGYARDDGRRRSHFAVALGSAYETQAALRIVRDLRFVDAARADAALALVDRVCAMAYRLAGRR